MSEIVRKQSPGIDEKQAGQYAPDELNADLAAASLARDLVNKLPTPAIDTRKFTIIHGLMQSMNHIDGKNETYIDTSRFVELMDRVSGKSVNVDGEYFRNLFAYLMKPKYIIQGMPQNAGMEEEKPGLLSRIWQGITGKSSTNTQQESVKK